MLNCYTEAREDINQVKAVTRLLKCADDSAVIFIQGDLVSLKIQYRAVWATDTQESLMLAQEIKQNNYGFKILTRKELVLDTITKQSYF